MNHDSFLLSTLSKKWFRLPARGILFLLCTSSQSLYRPSKESYVRSFWVWSRIERLFLIKYSIRHHSVLIAIADRDSIWCSLASWSRVQPSLVLQYWVLIMKIVLLILPLLLRSIGYKERARNSESVRLFESSFSGVCYEILIKFVPNDFWKVYLCADDVVVVFSTSRKLIKTRVSNQMLSSVCCHIWKKDRRMNKRPGCWLLLRNSFGYFIEFHSWRIVAFLESSLMFIVRSPDDSGRCLLYKFSCISLVNFSFPPWLSGDRISSDSNVIPE